MTWEEMMNPFYGVVVGKDVDPKTIVHSKYLQVGAAVNMSKSKNPRDGAAF